MKQQNVTKWRCEFSEGRTDVHDKQRNGRPSLISYDLLRETEGEIRANQHVTIRELHHIIPEVSKTTIHEAVTEKLGYRKLCARWVPKTLTITERNRWFLR
jgi:transposase